MFWLRQRFIESEHIFISTMQFQLKTRKQICLWCGCYVLRYRNFWTIAIRFRSFACTRKAHFSVCVSKTRIIYLNFTDRKKRWFVIHQQWAPAIRWKQWLFGLLLGFYSTENELFKCYNATPCTLSSCNILFNLTMEKIHSQTGKHCLKGINEGISLDSGFISQKGFIFISSAYIILLSTCLAFLFRHPPIDSYMIFWKYSYY